MFKRLRRAKTGDSEMTLVDHLAELRRRIITVLAALFLGVLVGFYFSQQLVEYLMIIPGQLVYLYPGEAFFVHLKIALVTGIVLAFPVIIYQILRFILPGLKNSEKKVLFLGLPFAMVLFIVGVVFAYKVILPLAYSFFMGFGTDSLEPLISIGSYVSFVLGIVLPFGIVFQLPLIVLLLTSIGILSPEVLARYRKPIVLVIFILSAFLTPPDVISQTLMAGPMLLLYEFSIILSKLVFWNKHKGRP